MLVVLEAAGMLVNRVSSEMYLSQRHSQGHYQERRPSRVRAGIVRLATAAWQAFRRGQERRALIKDLSARDDRLLADIGIIREQIPEVAAAATGKPQHPTQMVRVPHQVRYGAGSAQKAANDNVTDLAA